jgi:xanthine dehydrogenase accessory factor
MNRRETERVVHAIRRAQAAGERVALATVVRIRGSAYRREGARVVIRDDGSYECLLSGGCLEPAVVAAAGRVLETGEPTIAAYDLEEDSVWGLGIGCSGAVDVRIERVEDDPVTSAWLDLLERGTASALVTGLGEASGRLLVQGGGDSHGRLTPAELGPPAVDEALRRLATPLGESGTARVNDLELFFEVCQPAPRLVVFGGGHDAEPLARLAWELGFDVSVVDPRGSLLTAERFPHATLVPSHFTEFPRTVSLDERSHVVVMNHHLERDRESLRFALASPAAYVGLLGPRSRFRRLLDALRAQGAEPDAAAVARVRSPVGLALGAETPEEIALSILGEVLAVRRGFGAGFLNGRETSLHVDESRLFARS